MAKANTAAATSTYTFTPMSLPGAIRRAFAARNVPNVLGSPGIGKSAIMHRVAEEEQLCLVDFRASQCDPTDFNGFPHKATAKGRVGERLQWVPPMDIPLVGDDLPINPSTGEPYKGWLLFLDEVNSAPAAVQAALYKIVLDRKVGQQHIHPLCRIATAGNLITDRAVVHRMSTALASRLQHFTLEVTHETFEHYMFEADFDDRIIAFLRFRPELTWKFDPATAERTFPCPRTWEAVNRLLGVLRPGESVPVGEVAGIIGEGTATEFVAFCDMMGKVPTYEEIAMAPDKTRIPDEPSMLYAAATMVGRKICPDDIDQVVRYVYRMPSEFQVLTMRTGITQTPGIKTTKDFMRWATQTKTDVFSR